MKGTQPSAVLKNEAAEKEPKASLTHKLMSESESTKFIICENGTTIMKVSVVGLWELFFFLRHSNPFKEICSVCAF